MKYQEALPELIDAQMYQAIAVIPAYYWNILCWTCSHEGQSTFSCPYPYAAQHLYFAYRYYLFQVTANPQISRYLE